MTLSEYVNWYYTDGDYYAGADPEKDLAPMMKSMLEYYEKQEGLTADTVANFCKICGAVEKLPVQEIPASSDTGTSSSAAGSSRDTGFTAGYSSVSRCRRCTSNRCSDRSSNCLIRSNL